MNHYLIDYENVNSEGFKKLPALKKGDSVSVFFSNSCNSAKLSELGSITLTGAKLTFHKVATGTKNALDFQLSSYLGYLIANHGNEDKYFIVANDKGFGCLTNFWQKQKVSVSRIGVTLPQSTSSKSKKKKKQQQAATDQTTSQQSAQPNNQPKTQPNNQPKNAANRTPKPNEGTKNESDKNQSNKKPKKNKAAAKNMATPEEIKQYLGKKDKPEAILDVFNKSKSKVAIENGISKIFKDSKRAGAIYRKLKPLLKAKNKS